MHNLGTKLVFFFGIHKLFGLIFKYFTFLIVFFLQKMCLYKDKIHFRVPYP